MAVNVDVLAEYPEKQMYVNKSDGAVPWTTHFMMVADPNDDEGFIIPLEAIKFSPLLQTLLGPDCQEDQKIIPANRFEKRILYVVANYLNHFGSLQKKDSATATTQRRTEELLHNDEGKVEDIMTDDINDPTKPTRLPKPYLKNSIAESLKPYEAALISMILPEGSSDLTVLIGVLNVSNFLQLQPLLELAACALALRFRTKTPDEISKMFEGHKLPQLPLKE